MFNKINEKGFTLVELLVVVVIIAVLAAIAVPIFLNQKQKAQDSADQATISAIAGALNVAKSTGGTVDLSADPIVATDGTGATVTVPKGGAVVTVGSAAGNDAYVGAVTTFCVSLGTFKMTNADTKPLTGAACTVA